MILMKQGFSLVEIIIAMAIFGLIGLTIASFGTTNLTAVDQSQEYLYADALAEEGIEAIRAVRDRAWNELISGEITVSASSGVWALAGSGTSTVDGFTRSITVSDVCRDGAGDIAACPADGIDIHTKEVAVVVSWTSPAGVQSSVQRSSYLTNWDSRSWEQSSWAGGSGQAEWSDVTAYAEDSGTVATDGAGDLQLAAIAGGGCRVQTWDFDAAGEYTFDNGLIQVSGSEASLISTDTIQGFAANTTETYEFGGSDGRTPKVIHIDGDVYAVIYEGSGNDGFLKTLQITDAGDIITIDEEELEYDSGRGEYPDIMHVSGNIYAIAAYGRNTDIGRNAGMVYTIEILPDGTITATGEELTFESTNNRIRAYHPELVHVGGTTYAVLYEEGRSSDLWLRTFDMQNDGTLGAGVIDSLEIEPNNVQTPEIINIGNNYFAIAYRYGSGGLLQTLQINNNGTIDKTNHGGGLPLGIIDEFAYDARGHNPTILPVSGDVYLLSYRGSGSDGFLTSITIDNTTGQIANAAIETREYSANANMSEPYIAHIENDLYVLTGRTNDGSGIAYLIEVTNAGDIADDVIGGSFDITGSQTGEWTNTIVLDNRTLATVYEDGPTNDGYLVTYDILDGVGVSDASPTILPNSDFTGSDTVQWTSFTEVATTTAGSSITYQLSDDGGVSWQYWNGNAWAVTAGNDANSSSTIHSNIHTFSSANGTIRFRAFLNSDGVSQATLGAVSIGCANLQYEAGQVSTDENWVTVNTENIYVNPVIIASYQEDNNAGKQVSVRVRNVSTSSFELRLQDDTDELLANDPITYFVIEKGIWTIDGIQFEADTHDTQTVGSSLGSWTGDTISYRGNYVAAPVVFHQVMSNNDSSWISTFVSENGVRNNRPGQTDMWLALSGSEETAAHGAIETIGWIAVSPFATGTMSGTNFEIQQTPVNVGSGCAVQSFDNAFAGSPLVIASQQEMNGGDGSWTVLCGLNNTAVSLQSQEAAGNPAEESHTNESAAFLAIASAVDFSDGGAGGGGGGFETSATVTSSAFDMGAAAQVQSLAWTETIDGCPTCDITLQISAANDNGGSPGAWTSWYGAAGAGTTFSTSTGSIIPTALNGYRWVRYKAVFTSDGTGTPTLNDVTINYK